MQLMENYLDGSSIMYQHSTSTGSPLLLNLSVRMHSTISSQINFLHKICDADILDNIIGYIFAEADHSSAIVISAQLHSFWYWLYLSCLSKIKLVLVETINNK